MMYRDRFAVLAIGLLALGFASSARAGLVIDQQQDNSESFLASFSTPGSAQSFQQSLGNIAGAAVRLQSGVGSGTANITIDLYDNLPTLGGSLLRSGTVSGLLPGQLAMATWSPLITNFGQTYYLVFSSSNSTFGLAGSAENPYSLGQAFGNNYTSFPQFDFAFRTFAEINATPEPSSLALTGAVVAGITIAAMRKRRRSAIASER